VFLKEIHHRVKQPEVITSLELQSAKIPMTDTGHPEGELTRVKSMALVRRTLSIGGLRG
jgi:two-component sensor histidine kinase